jgi:hypothetical protein
MNMTQRRITNKVSLKFKQIREITKNSYGKYA